MDLVLQVLRVKGRATPEVIGDVAGAAGVAALERLECDGVVEATRFGFKLTDAGMQRAAELYEEERARAGDAIDRAYAAFVPVNDDIKQIVTDWQLREVGGETVVNDHRDADRDAGVIARLQAADAKVAPVLGSLAEVLPRFGRYAERLRRALDGVLGGDQSMVAAPMKDSYHTVWFELHEELIILSGRTRTDIEA